MSDVVAVALITSLATLAGSAGVTYLSHRLEVTRTARAARRARLDSAAPAVVEFSASGRKHLNFLQTLAEWQMEQLTGDRGGSISATGGEVGQLADAVERAEIQLCTLIDDSEAIAMLDELRRVRQRVINDLVAGREEGGDTAKVQACLDGTRKAHVLLSKTSKHPTSLVRSG